MQIDHISVSGHDFRIRFDTPAEAEQFIATKRKNYLVHVLDKVSIGSVVYISVTEPDKEKAMKMLRDEL